MQTYLTEQELLREESLFAPSETSYMPLEGRAYELCSFKEEVTEAEELPEPPISC